MDAAQGTDPLAVIFTALATLWGLIALTWMVTCLLREARQRSAYRRSITLLYREVEEYLARVTPPLRES